MNGRECVAMILAGGRGERLGALTHYYSKPVVYFGGSNRIIDFTLSNCRNSGIDTVGILSQCFTTDLNEYVKLYYESGTKQGGIHVLSSRDNENLYKGTADAVYKNLAFIDQFMPELVLVLASDHVYNMDYQKLIAFHKEKRADVTVAAIPVSSGEASKYGIINADVYGRVYEFEEKPCKPKSNLASMGIYVFKWSLLRKHLLKDSECKQSRHDFGQDILPKILSDSRLYAYQFRGYWRDVGTVDKLWEANMDQLDNPALLRRPTGEWDIGEPFRKGLPCKNGLPCRKENTDYFSDNTVVSQSIFSGGCSIFGNVKHSVFGNSVTVGKGAEIVNSVIMPYVYIGNNARIHNAVVGSHASLMDNVVIGSDYGSDFFVDRQICTGDVSLVAPWIHIAKNTKLQKNSHFNRERLSSFYFIEKERANITHEAMNCAAV